METINLQRLSSISVAIQIWESPNIKDQVRNLFLARQKEKHKLTQRNAQLGFFLTMSPPNHYEIKALYKDFQSIINTAVLGWESIELPIDVKNPCKDVVREIGERIYEWCEYVIETLEFDFKFAEKIYWKPDGTIDEDKIFKTWESDEEFLNHKTVKGPYIYFLACINVREDFITNNQDKMEKCARFHMPHFDLSKYNNKIYTLIAMYLYIHINNRAYDKYHSRFFDYIISPYEIFLLCAQTGYTKAALYFWKFIPNPSLPEITINALVEQHLFLRSKRQREKSVEMIKFLIDQMTVEQRKEFLQDGKNVDRLFQRILPVMPNHEIVLEIIENFLLKLSVKDHEKILKQVLHLIRENETESTKSKVKCLCLLFCKILAKLPEELKKKIFNVEFFKMPPYEITEIKIFKLIMSSIDQNARSEVIEAIKHGVMLLIRNEEIGKFKIFMEDILISDDERLLCKKLLFDGFLIEGKFETVNMLFNYFSMSEEEINSFKKGVDHTSILGQFIMLWRYDKAERFLEFIFPHLEERENLRNALPEDFFIYERSFMLYDQILSKFLDPSANSKDFYNCFFGFLEEENSVKNQEIYKSFRDELENIKEKERSMPSSADTLLNRLVSGKEFVTKNYCELGYDESELPNLFIKWICKDKNRRETITRKYNNDREKNFFLKLIFLMFNRSNSQNRFLCICPPFQPIQFR